MYTLNIYLDKTLISTRDNIVDYILKPVMDRDMYAYSFELLTKIRFTNGGIEKDFRHQLWISRDDDDWKAVIVDEFGKIVYNSFNNYMPPTITNGRDENGLLMYDSRGELIDMP